MRRGFTLLEILLAAAIFMTVMVVAVGVFGTTMSSSSTSNQLRTTSQTARYVFESMTREIRASHGLIVAEADGKQTVVVTPFEYSVVQNVGTLKVYQVEKFLDTSNTNGETKYNITRKIYTLTSGTNPSLTVLVEKAENLTLNQVKGSPTYIAQNANAGGLVGTGTNMIPDDLQLVDIVLPNTGSQQLRFVGYENNPDQQKTQPYIQLQLTIGSKFSGFAGQADKRAQTTLRTTIVPRDFASPFEVVQSRLAGGGQ